MRYGDKFLIRGIAALLIYPGMHFATAVNPLVGGADGGTGGAGAGSGAGAGGGSPQGGSGGQGGAPAAGAGHPADSGNVAMLRTEYDKVKGQYSEVTGKWEPWSKVIGNHTPEQFTQFSSVYTRVFQEAQGIAEELGYSEQELIEALTADPVKTLDYLRQEQLEAQEGGQGGQGGNGQDLQQQINEAVNQHLGPIQQRENQRMTTEANSTFERTVHGLLVADFKALGIDAAAIDPEEREMLMTATSEMLKYDEQAVWALKYEGKTAGVQKAYQEAKTFLDKYFVARSNRERTRTGGAGGAGGGQGPGAGAGGNQGGGGKKPSLEDMINDPGVIGEKYR